MPPLRRRARRAPSKAHSDASAPANGSARQTPTANDGDFVAGLDHGMRVLEVFSREHPQLTLSQVASLTTLSPATARRSLHTLEALGYIGRVGRHFLLRAKVLTLTSAYLTAIDAQTVLQPFLQELVNAVGGSSSVTVLSDFDIVYVAHASTNRAIRLVAGVGARYPAYATSMGRVLLAHQPARLVDAYLKEAPLKMLTQKTETSPRKLRGILSAVKEQGYAVVQDELDYGLVSVAVPIFSHTGDAVAAVNCSDITSRVDAAALVKARLSALRSAARQIEHSVTRYPVLANSVLGDRGGVPARRAQF